MSDLRCFSPGLGSNSNEIILSPFESHHLVSTNRAWAAAPHRPIIAITGDGGFGQYLAELCTAVKYNMNITHILLNNDQLGKITNEQEMEHLPVWETDLHNPNFAKFAENCGAKGIRVNDVTQLPAAVAEAIAYKGPAMVEIVSNPALI